MRLNVTSEIGRLKSVLVHLPGREIDVMVPPMMAQLLFDDILFGQVAREEHRRFQQLMRFVAQDVFDVQDLLEEIFDDEEVKREIVRDFAKRNNLSRRLTSLLGEERPSALAEVLIGGIPREKQDSGELPRFDLSPIPNYFFTRDPQVVLGSGVVVCGMATRARRREALLSKYIFEYHPGFRDATQFKVDFMEGDGQERSPRKGSPTIEGGDVLVARRDFIIVGQTERTNSAAIKQLAQSLREVNSDVKTVVVVE